MGSLKINKDCIFCKIITNKIPSYKIYEDNDILAFLDLSQTTPGHTLLIPKNHVKDIYEYDEKMAENVFKKIPKIIKAIRASNLKIKGFNIVNNNGKVAGQEVFHSHFHLIPRYSKDDTFNIEFTNNSKNYNQKKYKAMAENIKSQLLK